MSRAYISPRGHASWLATPDDESGVWFFACDTPGCVERGNLLPFDGRDYDNAADRAAADWCAACRGDLTPEDELTGDDDEE